MKIPIPIKEDGRYDFEYIKEMIKNSYGYEELKKYL